MGERWVQPVTLEGRAVRLEPLTLDHVADLWEVAAPNPELFLYMSYYLQPRVEDWTLEHFAGSIGRVIESPNSLAFATLDRSSGKAVGSTTYMEIREKDRGLEIGNTWLGAAQHRTLVNPENKYLLLRHAFETLGAVRVQLKTDGRNLRSQGAIAKLGARLEGILRRHLIMSDGFIRDTVMFSVIDSEWDAVKARLEERLGYVP